MKRFIWIALVATIALTMGIGGVSFAADDKVKKKLRNGNGNGEILSGQTVNIAELGKQAEVKNKKTIKVSSLPNGVKVYSQGEKGEWIRLGESYGGANTISELVVKVCRRPFITATLELNGLTEKQARKLKPGYGVYISHRHLKPEYRFSMEKLIKAYAEIDQLKKRLRENGLSDEVEADEAAVENLDELQKNLETAVTEIERLNSELSLRDETIATLKSENSALKSEIDQLKSTLSERNTQVEQLGKNLEAEKQKRKDALAEVRIAIGSFLERLDELENQ